MTSPSPPSWSARGASLQGRMPASFVRGGLLAGVIGYGATVAVDVAVDRVEPDESLAALCLLLALALSRRRPTLAGTLGLGVVFAESLSGFAREGAMSGSGLVLPVLVTGAGLFLGEVGALAAGVASVLGAIGMALLFGPQRPEGLSPEEAQRLIVLTATTGVAAALTFAGVRAHRRALAERRALEEELLHAQRLETVGLLAGGVAHDFNNLLTAIGGNAEILAEDDEPETRELAGEILDAQRRGSALTRQLLAFARRDVRRPERLDLAAAVLGMERLLGRILAERNRLELHVTGEVPVLADRSQVEQVVVNLVTNARDASPVSAAISVVVRAASGDEARAAGVPWEGGRAALLEVADRGAGMTAETRARMFEPFFTTKPRGQGTGLGLSTVHGIVAQSGGVLAVDTAPGRGTVFRILLPLAGAEAPAAAESLRPTPPAPGRGERVLVVEDDPGVRALVVRTLRAAGYDVAGHASGQELLEALATDGPAPGLLLSDMAMPGMEGPELARRVRDLRPGLPVVFMTGYYEEGHAAVPDALRKPFSPEELLHRVREALRGRLDPRR